jgi:D-hexose-6-phosphate mutarotase
MINKIFALPVVEQLTPVLSLRQIDGADIVVVDHPRVKASVALNGAHLLSWKPEGEKEGLWLSNATSFKKVQQSAVVYRSAGRGSARQHNMVCLLTGLPVTSSGR